MPFRYPRGRSGAGSQITMQMVVEVMTLDGVTEGISKMYLKKKTVPRTEKQPAKEK